MVMNSYHVLDPRFHHFFWKQGEQIYFSDKKNTVKWLKMLSVLSLTESLLKLVFLPAIMNNETKIQTKHYPNEEH